MPSPAQAIIWVVIGFFVITASVAILGLLGVVKIQPVFMRALFVKLILELAAASIIFFYQSVKLKTFKDVLKDSQGESWKWHYSDTNWYTEAWFDGTKDNKFTFRATTFYNRSHPDSKGKMKPEKAEIFRFICDPVSIGDSDEVVEVDCDQTILPEVETYYGVDRPQPTIKPNKVKIRMRRGVAIVGTWSVVDSEAGASKGVASGFAFLK